jgi:hypothetical protein
MLKSVLKLIKGLLHKIGKIQKQAYDMGLYQNSPRKSRRPFSNPSAR